MSKEYEIKSKLVQEQWLQLRIMSLLGYNFETCYLVCREEGGNKYLGGMIKFLTGGENLMIKFLPQQTVWLMFCYTITNTRSWINLIITKNELTQLTNQSNWRSDVKFWLLLSIWPLMTVSGFWKLPLLILVKMFSMIF